MNSEYSLILNSVRESSFSGFALREFAMHELSKLPGFDWCGIYRLEGEELVLDAYVGAATDHTRIQVGVGVCGSAVSEDRNKVITDVREEENYLACSLETRSEIVVLIRNQDQVLGQIDLDGHDVGRFGEAEEEFLVELAALLSTRWED